MPRPDPHSHYDTAQPAVTHLDWRARVDFDGRVLDGEARLDFAAHAGGPVDLDTRDLHVLGVTDEEGRPIAHALGVTTPVLGTPLRVELPAGVRRIVVRYRTSPSASALQWLEPAQTADGAGPFLYSQCQAIHARSVVPLQDTPCVRIRYRAELTVPAGLRGLMAARFVARSERGSEAVETWEMPEPIPPYLIAFAVGALGSRELGARSRVWAEPSVVERAAWEFAPVDEMLRVGEGLFGPYDWERFDVLVLPPAFPYGGMENPRLTFLTPTLLAGDRSLVSVVGHELAHSWTGNLVSNATAEHFWLNEGFTVFAERKIVEALEGPDVAELHAALGRRALDRAIARFAERGRPELTRLRTRLDGIDPDEAFSEVPYEKGYLFLRALEEAVGRERFAGFLRKYIATFQFRAITTEEVLALVEAELPGALAKVDAPAWIDGAGVPAGAPVPRSRRVDAVEAAARAAPSLPAAEVAGGWTPAEWQLYLEALPRPAPDEMCAALDARFALTASRNPEVLVAWLDLAVSSGFAPACGRVETLLGEVGRMKYLKPLYLALARGPSTRATARAVFARTRGGYHPIAQQVIAALLDKEGC